MLWDHVVLWWNAKISVVLGWKKQLCWMISHSKAHLVSFREWTGVLPFCWQILHSPWGYTNTFLYSSPKHSYKKIPDTLILKPSKYVLKRKNTPLVMYIHWNYWEAMLGRSTMEPNKNVWSYHHTSYSKYKMFIFSTES